VSKVPSRFGPSPRPSPPRGRGRYGPTVERVSEYLRRVGAATPEDTTRWLGELCAVLLRADSPLDVEASLVSVGDSIGLERRAFAGTPRELVGRIARLGYELLKGAPPPESVPADAWIGLRPELARLLASAIAGTGAADVASFHAQLMALRSDTAAYQLPDTIPPSKVVAPARVGVLAGTLLGSYELISALGSGGMGEVYRARHVRLGREVAVKVLRPEYASMPDVVQRFFQEAKIVNDINHPHIVQIIDFVELPSAVFCVMELLAGRTLSAVVEQEGPLSLSRITGLMGQVCEALEAAHARGVVHRDIKPDNVFVVVDADGREQVKVLDFGIARRLTPGDSARTQAGLVMGTPSYMAPEQAAGRPVDVRADVYAVGVVLYELLTGTSMIELRAAPTRVGVSAKGEAVPRALAEVVERCLSLDPAGRPASMETVLAAMGGEVKRASWPWALGAALILAGVVAWIPRGETVVVPEVVDAGVAPIVVVVEPKPVVDSGVVVVLEVDAGVVRKSVSANSALRKRLAAVKRRFDSLVARFGSSQLTTIERQTVAAALSGGELPASELSALLADAEASLSDAERRLGN